LVIGGIFVATIVWSPKAVACVLGGGRMKSGLAANVGTHGVCVGEFGTDQD
jgi:hypothetical protein